MPFSFIDKVHFHDTAAAARQRALKCVCRANEKNRGHAPRFFYTKREKVSAWELSDVRVLRSQNTRLSAKRQFRDSVSSCPFPSRTLPFSLQGSYSSCERRTSCRTSSRYDVRSAEPVRKSAAPFPGRAQAQTALASPACDVPPPSRCHGRARPAVRGRYPPHVLRSCSRRCLRGRHSRPAGAGARPE